MRAREIADQVGGEFVGDADVDILRVASIDSASAGDITFAERNAEISTNASCVLVPLDFSYHLPASTIKVKDPKLAFARASAVLHPPKQREPQIHPSAVISETAKLGDGLFVGAFVCIGDNSSIGDG